MSPPRPSLFALVALACALAAARPASADGDRPPDLVLTIEAPHPRVAVQEPILLVATLANPTAATASASGLDRAWEMTVEAREVGSATWTALSLPSWFRDEIPHPRDRSHALAPGASRVDACWAYPVGRPTGDPRTRLAPGRDYALRVRSDADGVVSNEVRVEVLAAEGAPVGVDPLLLIPEGPAIGATITADRIATLLEASPASVFAVHARRSYLACTRWGVDGYDPGVARGQLAWLREHAPWALAGDRERLGELMERQILDGNGLEGARLTEMLRRIAEDPAAALDAFDGAYVAAERVEGAVVERVPWGPTRAKRTIALLSAIPDARAIDRLERIAERVDYFARRAIAQALTANQLEGAPSLLVRFPGPALAAGLQGLFAAQDRHLVHEALWSLALDARCLDDAAAEALRARLGDTEVALARRGMAVVSEADPAKRLRATLAWLDEMGAALGVGKPLFAGRPKEHRWRVIRAVYVSLGAATMGGPPPEVLAAEEPALRACAVRLSTALAALRERPLQDYDAVTAHRELEELTVMVVQALEHGGVAAPALPLTLAVERPRVLPLEPILVRLTIANPTSAPAVIVGTWWNSTRFEVRAAEAKDAPWVEVDQRWLLSCILYAPSYGVLGPGEARTAPMWLYSLESRRPREGPVAPAAPPTSTAAALALAPPSGTFDLRAREGYDPPRYSTVARVEVLPPPEEEREALAAVLAVEGKYGGHDLIPGSSEAASLTRTAAFVEAHPASVYSIYMRRTYLSRAQRPPRGPQQPPRGPPQPPALAATYESWLREHAPWALVEEVHRSR